MNWQVADSNLRHTHTHTYTPIHLLTRTGLRTSSSWWCYQSIALAVMTSGVYVCAWKDGWMGGWVGVEMCHIYVCRGGAMQHVLCIARTGDTHTSDTIRHLMHRIQPKRARERERDNAICIHVTYALYTWRINVAYVTCIHIAVCDTQHSVSDTWRI